MRNIVVGPSSAFRWDVEPAATLPVDDDDAPLVPLATNSMRQPVAAPPSGRSIPYARTAADIVRRPDMPVVRNVRRGSAAEALRAFRELGAEVLVEEPAR